MMAFNKFIPPSVRADASFPTPMYRPSLAFSLPVLKVILHHYVEEVIVDLGCILLQMNHPKSATGMR